MKGAHHNSTLVNFAAIEQWSCFLLGVLCIAFGILGVSMERNYNSLPGYVAWLGSAYQATLRGTALLCIGLGIALVYRSWRHP